MRFVTRDAWVARHRGHGDLSYEVANPGQSYYLVCECGARLLVVNAAAPKLAGADVE